MGLELLRTSICKRYVLEERGHACAILDHDFQSEFVDLQDCLDRFSLRKSDILARGKNKSPIAKGIDGLFTARGWREKHFDVIVRVDGEDRPSPRVQSAW